MRNVALMPGMRKYAMLLGVQHVVLDILFYWLIPFFCNLYCLFFYTVTIMYLQNKYIILFVNVKNLLNYFSTQGTAFV